LLACTLSARAGRLADRVYVHAKIEHSRDAWLTLGSTKLNEHSLFNDTEMNRRSLSLGRLPGKILPVQVFALTSTQIAGETLDLLLSREAAEDELREVSRTSPNG
jgi:hypothetical protein